MHEEKLGGIRRHWEASGDIGGIRRHLEASGDVRQEIGVNTRKN